MSETRQFGSTEDFEIPTRGTDPSITIYEDLREELSKPIDVEPLPLVVPQRPNIEVVFNPVIDFDTLRMWMKRAVSGKAKEFDPLKLAYTVMSNTCIGIKIKGREARDEEGTPYVLSHRQFQQMLGAGDTVETIRRLYGVDGHIITTAQRVMDEAGYGDIDLEEGSDPLGMD